MASKDNSDYTKTRTKLYDLIPEVYQSDTNRALFGNLFDRFLTKKESTHAVGYVGEGNNNAIVSRQLPEPTLHRQGHQLQPILRSKVGSVEHLASWEDIRNEYERLGVDVDRLDEWGKVLQFNWIPPIDIDKLIHFSDYYWFDEFNTTSRPEYITMRSRCTTAIANSNFWQRLVDEYGSDFPIAELLPHATPADLPEFDIIGIVPVSDEVVVAGDITSDLALGQFFDIAGTVSSDGTHNVTTSPVYDPVLDRSTFNIEVGGIVALENSVGSVLMRRFNRLKLAGEYHRLLEPGFVFFIRNTTNLELNNTFWQSAGADYDSNANETIVTLSSYVTDDTQGGVISLQENLDFYLAERECQCAGGIGWDVLQWDDNPDDPLWDGDFSTLMGLISNPTPPPVTGTDGDLWYDTVNDKFYQFSTATGWKLLYNNFSLVLDDTEGFALWDFTEDCGVMSRVPSAEQWTNSNFWLHKTDVPNFSKAKQAVLPIIEFDWDLELNEWTLTEFNWKYRDNKFTAFADTDSSPSIIELAPIEFWEKDATTDEIIIDARYGDLTNFFVPGTEFQAETALEVFEVLRSTFVADAPGLPYRTRITLTVNTFPTTLAPGTLIPAPNTPPIASNTPLFPFRTSLGDFWRDYGDHWLFQEANNATPTAHQPDNPFVMPALSFVPVVDIDYDYTLSYYAQNYTVTAIAPVTNFIFDTQILPGDTRSLNERALVGANNVRVYINDIRQYGTYSETVNTIGGIDFVSGISFIPGLEPARFDEVRVEVGEASIKDFGNYVVPLRMIEDNTAYDAAPVVYGSVTKYRRAEQVKTNSNQYPLFDVYNVDSTPANEASAIFGYETSNEAPVNLAVGLRTVQDDVNQIYNFDQFIINQDDGILKAWRDYSNKGEDLWYNPLTRELFFFDNLSWSKKTDMGGQYREAVVSDTEPSDYEKDINGLYWVDLLNETIFIRDAILGVWNTVTDIDILTSDITLQSIWRKGLNNEEYIPDRVDWRTRSELEYNAERDLFISERVIELLATSGTLTEPEATTQATTEWLNSQANPHSPTGVWVGDWEVPHPLYFNHLNENRKLVNSRELLTHFTTIIDSQPRIPGYNGNNDSMFHLIPTDEVNFGLGGTIHEYNDSYDTAFSSTFVNNVTPPTLFEFAHDQYESLLNNLEEIFRRNAVDHFLDVSVDSLVNMPQTISNAVIDAYELNDSASLIYGDSTTFTDVDGAADLGVRNWIATLPYLKIISDVLPERLVDSGLGLNQIIHHDGHRRDYEIEQAVIEEIIGVVIDSPDDRTRFPGPQDPPLDTFGRTATSSLPPNNIVEFSNEFNTTIENREGVYWYYTPIAGDRVLYRLEVADIGDQEPSSLLPDGTLWMDITVGFEVLRVKTTNGSTVSWVPVVGNSIGDGRLHNGSDPSDVTTSTSSAWSVVNLNTLLADIILDLETRLYNNVPDTPRLRYDFEATRAVDPTLYQTLLRQSFLNFTTQSEIDGPFLNTQYSATDPFTWNYKYSIPGAGFNIVATDPITNTISVQGDHSSFFDPCQASAPGFGSCPSQVEFFIKNSTTNDGKWTTVTSTAGSPAAVYDILNDVTIIEVVETVSLGDSGLAYSGILPSSLNVGSESGGDWKDYYHKVYNTPYPHLEPWKLQGFNQKPTWWDAEYANDDVLKWGNRRWKYAHGFDIVDVNTTTNAFTVDGDFREIFPTGKSFSVDESVTHFGTYQVDQLLPIDSVNVGGVGTSSLIFAGNVVPTIFVGMHFSVVDATGNFIKNLTVQSSTFTGPPNNETIVVVEESIDDATGFDNVGGAIYDAFTNRTEILTTAVALAAPVEGRVSLAVGMWEQIRLGNIKAGERYPNNVLSVTGVPSTDVSLHGIQDPQMPTYNYFSVNIDNDPVSSDGGTTEYNSDEVLPPFWDFVPQFSASPVPFDRPIRSVFFNFSTEINNPSIDYLFGDAGPIEYEWRVSSQFLYDQLIVAYKMDPIRLITHTFGIDFVELGGLQVDIEDQRVLSHNRTDFHGEIVDNEILRVDGTNQWYVNYNRFSGFDVSLSDFRSLWTEWTAPLMYQMASFVDTDSISIDHRVIPLSDSDYTITAKRSPAVEDFWNDAFDVAVLKIPPQLPLYDTQSEWRFELSTNASSSRNIEYYGVHNYQFGVDITTDTCLLYHWDIVSASAFSDSINVTGNQVETFETGRTITINNSTGNDGTYVIESAVYDTLTDQTLITVVGQLPSSTNDGTVDVEYRTIPWVTGDSVYLSSSQLLPIPLEGDNINGLFQYFIIVVDDTTFRLALTRQDAFDGNFIQITGTGRGDSFVGQILGTFTALNGERTNTLWRRYAIDKSVTLSFDTPHDVGGVQNLINIIHGYEIRNHDQGWRINDENGETDFDTDRLVSWQVEIERFINTLFTLRTTRDSVNDRFEVSVDASTDEWTFIQPNNHLITGDAVNIISNGTLPAPLIQGLRYYIIRTTFDKFKLATNKQSAMAGAAIDITSTGSGTLNILQARDITFSAPHIEINPARNGIWFRPSRGIVSDVISGPTEDVRNQQLLFDQYSRPLTLDQVRVFREDQRTQISVAQGLINDVEIGSDTLNPYRNIHLGGAHIFVDTYEHATVFNNYNSADQLIYDPFIGLNLNKIEYDFDRQVDFTQRPNMGGFYFETFFNQNASLRRNIEANIEDLRYAYDTYEVSEGNPLVEHSRKSLGYEGSTDYLDNLNLNDKSQFAFWRGLIQQKGSVNAVNAFVNSRRFIDARVDEFWAYKVADFGSTFEQEYPELFITTVDSRTNDFRMEFVTENNPTNDDTFVAIDGTDEERWFNQPDQVEALRDNGQNLYFDMKAVSSISTDLPTVSITTVADDDTFEVDGLNQGTWKNTGISTDIPSRPIFRHNFKSSDVVITVDIYEEGHTFMNIETGLTFNVDSYPIGSDTIRVFEDGVEKIKGVDWNEATGSALATTITFTSLPTPGATISVLYSTSTYVSGTHFEHINSNIVRMVDRDLIPHALVNFKMTIWGLEIDNAAQNPARLIDREADTVISAIQMWDPARGHHYFNSAHNIHLTNVTDVALYNNGTNATLPQEGPWGINQVGTTWHDVSKLDYVPYYDEIAYPDVEDRLRLWGQLAGYGASSIYEWVKSDIPPMEYDAAASSEEGDNSIPENVRKSGTARKVLFENVGTVGSPVWVPYHSITRFEEFDPLIDSISSTATTYTFQLTNPAIAARGEMDIYINGALVNNNAPYTATPTVTMTGNDRVRFVESSITATDIETNELLMEDYQYSTFTTYDNLNNPHTEYYFWVENKGTIDRSSTRTLSVKSAAQQLVDIPISYMVNQKVLQEETIVTESDSLLDRIENHNAAAGQTTYVTAIPVAPLTPVQVFVDGFLVPPGNVTTGTQSLTLATPAIGGENVKIEYTGLYDITTTVPTRFVQAIVRGLRGIIDADRRYTIRFVRDFTLRDDLSSGGSAIALKDNHEEWKIFRENQLSHIDRYLWDKITESMVGYKLNDPSIRVPSLNRELYDARFLTSTQIGLRTGQKFTDGALAVETVLADLQNPDNNFQPVDINVFFETNNFDTPEDIILSMDKIYNTFPFDHVNRIYFSVLHDAMSFKDKYEDMFKTSMVALHGVRPFQVAGVFDD